MPMEEEEEEDDDTGWSLRNQTSFGT